MDLASELAWSYESFHTGSKGHSFNHAISKNATPFSMAITLFLSMFDVW